MGDNVDVLSALSKCKIKNELDKEEEIKWVDSAIHLDKEKRAIVQQKILRDSENQNEDRLLSGNVSAN